MELTELYQENRLTYNREVLKRIAENGNAITPQDLQGSLKGKNNRITKNMLTELFYCLELGMSLSKSCIHSGVPKSYINEAIRLNKLNPTLEPFATLVSKLGRAETSFEVKHLQYLNEADDWRARMELLKTRRSEDYNVKTKVDFNVQLINELQGMLDNDIVDAGFIKSEYPELADKMGLESGELESESVSVDDYIIE